MKRNILTAVTALVASATISSGCLDRKPAPVCPVPIEIATSVVSASAFDGVDLIVMVDDSGSMAQEQAILSTGFFTLINSLTAPLSKTADPTWGYDAVDNMRVAIVSTDMGLIYGESRSTDGSPTNVPTCEGNPPVGDDGNFLLTPTAVTTVIIEDGEIRCEQQTDGTNKQCPQEFTCNITDTATGAGVCTAPSGVETVNCVPVTGQEYAETSRLVPNRDLTTQVACMALQGTDGCGYEQQLESPVYGLEKHAADFLVDTHLLAVLIVSDEEDCSIENPALFSTAEWTDQLLRNVACNVSPANEANLFAISRYRAKFASFKGDNYAAVIFAAIVGVPTADDVAANNVPVCEGTGDAIPDCLSDANTLMKMEVKEFHDDATNTDYKHFAPACTRYDNNNVPVTEARPGRRYVGVAQEFGPLGYIYSICNPDWSPAMRSIAEIIAKQISSSCYAKKLEWKKLPTQPAGCANSDCGEANCDVVAEILQPIKDPDVCPDKFYTSLSAAEKKKYTDRMVVVPVPNASGQSTTENVFCPLPKLATPKACEAAHAMVDSTYKDHVGWYYCEEEGEDFKNSCGDKMDNDGDGLIDCDDDQCGVCCSDDTTNCDASKCSYGVEITEAGKDAAKGYFITVQCLQQFSFEDENCQEDSSTSCYDAKDNIDEDGNGVWNCTYGKDSSHYPDPNCCPMKKTDGLCDPDLAAVVSNCKQGMAKDMPTSVALTQDGWRDVPACIEHIKALGCTPPGVATAK